MNIINWNIIQKIRRILRIGIIKTLYVNFSKLPFSQAIKLPILLAKNVYIYDLTGEIAIEGPIKSFMIRFGYFGEDTLVWKNNKILLKIAGKIIFRGSSHYGIGVVMRVEPGALLTIGDNVRISNLTKIICYQNIEIGDNCRIAWESQIIDTTFHFIKNIETGEVSERHKSIKIGKNNWIGNRTSIMKGSETPDFCIVASNSLINKSYSISSYCLLGGIPAKLIKTNIYRVMDEEEDLLLNQYKVCE